MGNTIQRPTSNEVAAVKTMQLHYSDDDIIIFNAQKVGPMDFAGLSQANYGPGFRMPTMSELVPLVHSSLEIQDYKTAKRVINTLKDENQDSETAKEVIDTLRNYRLIGNTGILYVPKGMFVQDNPNLESGIVLMDQKTLEKRLGSYQEGGVVFSDDKSVRFVPYGFKIESQSPLELSQNPAVIALTGSQENAGRLARASDIYKVNPFLFALNKSNSPKIRVAGFYSSGEFDEGLNICANIPESSDDGCAFGIWDGKTEYVAVKKPSISLM